MVVCLERGVGEAQHRWRTQVADPGGRPRWRTQVEDPGGGPRWPTALLGKDCTVRRPGQAGWLHLSQV